MATLFFASERSTAAVIVVDSTGGGDTSEIQEAIDAASLGDTVLVRSGVYVVRESITFRGKTIAVRSENGAEETVITFSDETVFLPIHKSLFTFQNGEAATSVLKGFTLLGSGSTARGSVGVSCRGSSPTLRACTVTGNPFGGFHCVAGAAPTVDRCTIVENTSPDEGGGIWCRSSSPVFTECVIHRNAVTRIVEGIGGEGGGIYCSGASNPRFVDCTISGNLAPRGRGGGICSAWSAAPILTRCLIEGNAARSGGGFYARRSGPTLSACALIGNFAEGGGALFLDEATSDVFNSAISGNLAAAGGGVHCGRSSSASFAHCTVAGNFVTSRGGGFSMSSSALTLVNCIVWANSGGSISPIASAIETTFSCVQTESRLPGAGNINRDPLFVASGVFDFERFLAVDIAGEEYALPDFIVESPDYRLRSDSPAVDAGSSLETPLVDIEGIQRPCWRRVDMGAHEYCERKQPPARFVRGDCNGDGDTTGVSDAIFLLNHNFLGTESPRCEAACEVNGDGDIKNVADAVYDLNFKFLGTARPPEPFPVCGPESLPSDRALLCEFSPEACN